MSPVLNVQNLSKIFLVGEVHLKALNNISFQVNKGELVGIVGESGSGKSSLLHILGTIDTPSSGNILIDEKNPFSGSDETQSRFRNQYLGFVFQQNNLLAELNAIENIMLPCLIRGISYASAKKSAEYYMNMVNLISRKNHFPAQLSGGEQQRVAIARALINEPALVLADEPTGSLDSTNAHHVENIFFELNQKLKTTFIIVTHNEIFAQKLKRVIRLKDGKIIADDSKPME